MLVAHLANIQPVEEVEVTVAVVTPSRTVSVPTQSECLMVELAAELVLATIRGLPLAEAGTYRFQVGLKGQPLASVDVPVVTQATVLTTGVH